MPLAPTSDAMAKWMDDNSPTPWGAGAFGYGKDGGLALTGIG
jgi:hypothetical protein